MNDIAASEAIADSTNGGHTIAVDGAAEPYSNVKIGKTGDSDSGDEADFYGDNATAFAMNGATPPRKPGETS